jgi:protein-disulfide isomerase
MKTIHAVLLASLAVATADRASAAEVADASSPATVVATIGGAPVTLGELDALAGNRLLALRTEEWNAKVRILHDMIGDRLLAQEAAARKVSLQELLKAEVSDKAAPISDTEVNATYEGVKERFKDKPEAELKKLITDNLRQQREQARRSEYLRELRDRAGVRVLLDPPRADVSDGGGVSKGPQEAPVTIVEFSDFQCPYCARVAPAVKKLQETYGDRLRVVFRNYPLPIHPNAPKAAEAALCARDQGKFWEMHDKLFGNQQKLQVADLKATAAELGLDPEVFGQCLDTGRHEASWRADQGQGTAYGVSGTPAFFINGRFLGGAQPYENFAEVVDDELQRKGLAKPK